MQDLVRQWKAKPLHGRYRSRIEDNAIDTRLPKDGCSQNCPKMKEEVSIQNIRTTDKISYIEAKRKYYAAMPANTTYAQVTASGSDNTTAKKFIQELIPDIAQIIDQQVKKAIDEVIKTSLSIYLPSTSSERRPMRRDQYDLDAASIVSDTPSQLSDKRKRTQYIRTEELVCLTDTSESQLDELSQTKRKKGWPKGKRRKPPKPGESSTANSQIESSLEQISDPT
ncbi:unnamed protein product [Acanthoscelides obtectus]|uniref:Uncharacterized protein n=1 Tax=Acanthoscelides obtectus TaxID=200917 RepID=A0A9P0QJ64_ACAOB|nr:unnamed protein product [Acanthoscelides obtectus]CAK1685662.1 hypothetical protein AOBTE_LOCUS35554 [Acanthoscelides obtectus]